MGKDFFRSIDILMRFVPHINLTGTQENSEEQREVLQKKIASFEKEFGKSTSLSFTEMKRQIDTVISLAVECIRSFVRPLSANSSNRDRHLVLNEVTILAI